MRNDVRIKASVLLFVTGLLIPTVGYGTPTLANMRALALVVYGQQTGTAFHVGQGCWVTAAHVVSPPRAPTGIDFVQLILHDGSNGFGSVKARHAEADVAAIALGRQLPYSLPLTDRVPVPGDEVWVVGFPGHSRAYGQVVPVRAKVHVNTGAEGLLWIVGSVFYGHSGAPVLNSKGEVVGVATQIHPWWFEVALAVPVGPAREIARSC